MKNTGTATGFIQINEGVLELIEEKTSFPLRFSLDSIDLARKIADLAGERVRVGFELENISLRRIRPMQIERLPEEYLPLLFKSIFRPVGIEEVRWLDGYFNGETEEKVAILMPTIFEPIIYNAMHDNASNAACDILAGVFGIQDDWDPENMYRIAAIEGLYTYEEYRSLNTKNQAQLPSAENSEKSQRPMRKAISTRTRYEVLLRDGHRCCDCGTSPVDDPFVRLEIDHRIPVSKGGSNHIENLQTLCWACNNGKSDRVDHKIKSEDVHSDVWSA
jgi:hypothetical protein